MRYYSTNRPVGVGTLPQAAMDVLSKVVNFDQRQFVEEISREAWGYIETTEPVSLADLQAYELVDPTAVDVRALIKEYAFELVKAGWSRKEALEEAKSMSIEDLQEVLK